MVDELAEQLEAEPDGKGSPAASRRGEHTPPNDNPEIPQEEAHKDEQ